jgi:DNA ligase-1
MPTKQTRFRPMLAPSKSIDPSAIRYPMLASPKYDGIRCVIRDGLVLSRSLKPIPNRHIRGSLEALGARASGFDGELMLPHPATFQAVSSAVMAHDDEPPSEWFFAVFDCLCEESLPFHARLEAARRRIAHCNFGPHVRLCEHVEVRSADELEAFEASVLEEGHEGVMLRAPDGPYKFGRATAREGYLYKLKRFVDSEAEIVGVLELQRNENEAFVGELGQTKRRTLKANKVDAGVMGKLVVRDLKTGVEFKIGTGFTAEQRASWWRCRDVLIGRVVRYRYQEHGVKDKPRIASFTGVRDRRDMGG